MLSSRALNGISLDQLSGLQKLHSRRLTLNFPDPQFDRQLELIALRPFRGRDWSSVNIERLYAVFVSNPTLERRYSPPPVRYLLSLPYRLLLELCIFQLNPTSFPALCTTYCLDPFFRHRLPLAQNITIQQTSDSCRIAPP